MPLSSALRFFLVCGLVPWHLRDPDQSTCVATIYGLNSGVFLSALLYCLILTGAWFGALSRVCLRAYYPIYCLFFYPPQDMCICMLIVSSSPQCGLSFPPWGCELDYESALSRRLHALT